MLQRCLFDLLQKDCSASKQHFNVASCQSLSMHYMIALLLTTGVGLLMIGRDSKKSN